MLGNIYLAEPNKQSKESHLKLAQQGATAARVLIINSEMPGMVSPCNPKGCLGLLGKFIFLLLGALWMELAVENFWSSQPRAEQNVCSEQAGSAEEGKPPLTCDERSLTYIAFSKPTNVDQYGQRGVILFLLHKCCI